MTRKSIERVLPFVLPPSSPPTMNLLSKRNIIQTSAEATKTMTENPREPAGTK